MRKRRRAVPAFLAALGAVAICVAAPVGPARAEDPVLLTRGGRLTDTVGALSGRAPAVRYAVSRLYDTHQVQLFVAYVGGFSGRSPQDWANATAVKNGLGRKDLLLAVATRDRQYAVSADQDSGLTRSQLNEVSDAAIEPALRSNDWAGAAIGASDGYDAVLAGRPVTAPAIVPGAADPGSAAGGDGAAALWIPVVAVAAAAGVGGYVLRRRRGRRRPPARPAPGPPAWSGTAPQPKQPTPLTPLPQLEGQARQLLVATDDAVRTSQEDVGFAAAQFGDDAAKPFGEAVEYARSELTAAFRLRQKLDDAVPEDDETRRQMLDEILSRCTQANRRLDAEAEAFDRLRAMEANAPQVLERAEATAAALPGRIAAAETALGPLAQRYTDTALDPVTGHPAEARDRMDFARTSLDQAGAAIGTDHGRVAVFVRAAESALDQAATLADSVTRRERELRAADGRLRDALAETDADVAQARGQLAGRRPQGAGAGAADDDLQALITRAENVLADVRGELAAGRYDPIAALRRVEGANAGLDRALAGAREREDGGRRAHALLEQALLAARSEVAAARDVITTHRGAIGSRARTRLTEAERRLRLAESAAATDAPGAPEHAREADRLARDAQAIASQDLGGYGDFSGYEGGGRAGGGMSGMGGAVLGGILLGGILGTGGAGAGRGYGGPGPGSFGGGQTRGRLGGAGRF